MRSCCGNPCFWTYLSPVFQSALSPTVATEEPSVQNAPPQRCFLKDGFRKNISRAVMLLKACPAVWDALPTEGGYDLCLCPSSQFRSHISLHCRPQSLSDDPNNLFVKKSFPVLYGEDDMGMDLPYTMVSFPNRAFRVHPVNTTATPCRQATGNFQGRYLRIHSNSVRQPVSIFRAMNHTSLLPLRQNSLQIRSVPSESS
jgi:hypothetical protein